MSETLCPYWTFFDDTTDECHNYHLRLNQPLYPCRWEALSTPYSDIPEGCVLSGPESAQIFTFSQHLLKILNAMYLVPSKVASNQAKIATFLHLSYNYLCVCLPLSPKFELLNNVRPGRWEKVSKTWQTVLRESNTIRNVKVFIFFLFFMFWRMSAKPILSPKMTYVFLLIDQCNNWVKNNVRTVLWKMSASYPKRHLRDIVSYYTPFMKDWLTGLLLQCISPSKKQKTIHYGPWDRNWLLPRFGDRTHSESPARTLMWRLLHELEPKTYLWRYFAEPLRHRLLADRWRRYIRYYQ